MIWKNEVRKLEDLSPAKYNPRKLGKKAKEDLNASLEQFDLVDPIIINTTGVIIGGHQRVALLRDRGIVEVDVRVPERQLNEVEEKELNLRLNKNTGEFDPALLTDFDPAMLVNVGFDGDFVDDLFELAAHEDKFDVQKAHDEIKVPVTVPGDIYLFPGGHRLMCGSATSLFDCEALMDGQLADLVYTDPPYNVDYKGKAGSIKNDNQGVQAFDDFLFGAFGNALHFSAPHASVYCWFAMSNYTAFRTSIERAGWRYMQVIFWLKDRFTLSMGWFYHRITEPCMIFYKDWGRKFVNPHYAKNHDMWEMDRLTFEESLEILYQRRDASKDYQHPNQKPVRLAERALKKNSAPGHIVLDLFCGGGSTLLCCHQLDRRCYAMELDPKFCDVIVSRFEQMFNVKIEKLERKT